MWTLDSLSYDLKVPIQFQYLQHFHRPHTLNHNTLKNYTSNPKNQPFFNFSFLHHLFTFHFIFFFLHDSFQKGLGFLGISFPLTNSHPTRCTKTAKPRKAFAQAFQVARGREVNHHRTYRPERDGMGGAQLWWWWLWVGFGVCTCRWGSVWWFKYMYSLYSR